MRVQSLALAHILAVLQWLPVAVTVTLLCLAPLLAAQEEVPGSAAPDSVAPMHPNEMTPLTPDGSYPRFTPELLHASGYPDHLHAFAWPDWRPPQDSDGTTYGPGSLCLDREVVPRPGLTVDPDRIQYKQFELVFNEKYAPCDLMLFVELCDMGRIWCRELLNLEVDGTLHIVNPDDSNAYQAMTGFGIWRLYELQGNNCQVQPIPILMARTLIGHAAVSLVTLWTLQENLGDELPPWLVHGLAAYVADEGVHLNNYMAQFRPQSPVLLSPSRIDAILGGEPNADPETDRRLFRQATYSAFLMVWQLVENQGGMARLREFLGGISRGMPLVAACHKYYHTNPAGLAERLDPLVTGEPIGDAVQSRRPHSPPG